MVHTTKGGVEIELKDLETGHLKNIISMIERMAKKGVIIKDGGGYWDVNDIWFDEEILQGDKALQYLNHKSYIDELKKRIIN